MRNQLNFNKKHVQCIQHRTEEGHYARVCTCSRVQMCKIFPWFDFLLGTCCAFPFLLLCCECYMCVRMCLCVFIFMWDH